MSKHTPGPWRLGTRCRSGTGTIDAGAAEGRGMIPVAFVYNPDAKAELYGDDMSKAPTEQAIANARLIAAAPDLLAALKRLVAADNCNYCTEAMRSEGMFDAARAAIARATGAAEAADSEE